MDHSIRQAFICDAIRTPIGRYGGALKDVRPDDLGAVPLRALIEVVFYALGAWGLWVSGWEVAAAVFAASAVLVMIALRDRYAALLAHPERQSGDH